MDSIRIAVIGLGKIARDQHLPAIEGNADFELVATAGPAPGERAGVPHYPDLAQVLAEIPGLDAVAICTPPQVRGGIALEALRHGIGVLLEKPPGAALSEVEAMCETAERAGAPLFAAWHSRFAGGVDPARDWLANRSIHRARVVWREDVRVWHPRQEWIWQPGGLGVFDPGINALSIATRILPHSLLLSEATLAYPENRDAPIAAELKLTDTKGAAILADFDWRQTGTQTWDVTVETDAGTLALREGGARLELPGSSETYPDREYAALYVRFAGIVRSRRSEVDIAPFRLVADAFLNGRRRPVEAFEY